jgi:hypothetical protein
MTYLAVALRWVPTAAPPRGLLAVGSQHVDVDASQHPLVLAEAVGLPADIAATQRAEVAEVRSCTSALNRVLGGRT